MSGHSKWSTIKRKKGAQDAKRGQIFGRLSKEISIAVKEGKSADPSSNSRLRLVLQNAKAANMPKDKIERALHKSEAQDSDTYQQPTYEGYAPEGIAVYVECMTDKLTRTVSQIRHLFNKYGGNLATSGALDHLFTRKAFFLVEVKKIEQQEETVLDLIDAGMDEVQSIGEQSLLSCPFAAFGELQKKIESLSLSIVESEIQRIPKTMIRLAPKATEKVQHFLDLLEEDDDVERVFHNLSEPESS